MSDGDGYTVDIHPLRLCWFVDNGTMNGEINEKAANFGKNGNQRTAEAFREGVQSGTSTLMLLCPSHDTTGNPKLWLEVYSKAGSDAQGQKQVRQYTFRGFREGCYRRIGCARSIHLSRNSNSDVGPERCRLDGSKDNKMPVRQD